MTNANTKDAYLLEVDVITSQLDVDPNAGLSAHDAERRLKIQGENTLPEPEVAGFFSIILKQFKSPIIYILIFACALTLVVHEYIDSLVIAITIIVNVAIGAFQEGRANNAFAALTASQTHTATVIRDGVKRVIPTEHVVEGDIVRLDSGSFVPADIRLFRTKNLKINESSLTGEWIEVSKHTERITHKLPLAEQENMAWMGTFVTQGYGRGVVVATGMRTEFGKLAESFASVSEQPTPLQKSVHHLANILLLIITCSVLFIVFVGFMRGIPGAELLLITVAVAVAVVPEGLPAAVTIVLAVGMENILKKGGLVRNLLAAETLGSTTIILTDKTGTLTEGNMALKEIYPHARILGKEDKKGEERALRAAVLGTDAFIDHAKDGNMIVHGRPVERAITNAGIEKGMFQERLREESPRIDYLQFESKRRFSASLHTEGASEVMYISGAPEYLISQAVQYHDGTGVKKMTTKARKVFSDFQEKESNLGHRMIAVATKKLQKKGSLLTKMTDEEVLSDTTLLALFVLADPVRKDVPASIALAQSAGARVIMMTGDNPLTAHTIAREVGIIPEGTEGMVHVGEDTVGLTDAELGEMISHTDVFARVLPNQKLRISRILKNRGEVVAMTGDGVNDAPALRSADIGVALGSGTEVAKEASDLVLITNSFSVIVSAIAEGRKIIDNLRKILSFLLTTAFGEIFIISAALVIGGPMPLLPIQILWTNIIGGSFISVALAFEPQEPGVMKRSPRRRDAKSILTKRLLTLILITACVTGTLMVIAYVLLLARNVVIEEIHTVMFLLLAVHSFFFVFVLKNLSKSIWKINPFSNMFLVGAVIFSALLLSSTLFFKPLRDFLELTLLTPFSWILIGVALFLFVSVIELLKHLLFVGRNSE